MAPTPATAPTLDSVSLVCLVLGPDGFVRWGNAAGENLDWSPRHADRHFLEIVHPHDIAIAGALLDEAASRGHAERTIRAPATDTGEPVHLQCILDRTAVADDVTTTLGRDRAGEMLLQAWDVTRSVTREHELERQAHRDPLTGVANRLAFMARLDQELALSRLPSSTVAVFYADVDDFKRVNDRYGHEFGDRVLVELARRLSTSLRPADMLGRLGGDEFAMICPDLLGWPAAVALIERLRRMASEPIASPDGGEIRMSLSLGTAFADQRDERPERAAALLARADAQMFHEKPRSGEDLISTPRSIDLR